VVSALKALILAAQSFDLRLCLRQLALELVLVRHCDPVLP
jgi:hypothetical protein